MKITHKESNVITTIEWTEKEKDLVSAALDEVLNDNGWMESLPEEMRDILMDFFQEAEKNT